MMQLIVFIFILVVGLIFGLSLEGNEGLVILAYGGKSYEMTLWFAGLTVLISFFVLHYTMQFFGGIFSLGPWIHNLRVQHRKNKAQAKTNQGLIEFAEGRWAKAQKHLAQGAELSDAPLVNYVYLAQVAQEQGEPLQRDHYLALAKKAGVSVNKLLFVQKMGKTQENVTLLEK